MCDINIIISIRDKLALPHSSDQGLLSALLSCVNTKDPEKMEEDKLGPPELSNVAWFLSLVVMLLVLRQKAQNEGATAGEYRRGAKSPKIHSLKDGIAWQAWVSDQEGRERR